MPIIIETFVETLTELSRTPAVETAAAWLATYWLHSALLLGAAGLAGLALGHRRLAVQETLWRVALVGGLVTASLQLGLGFRPLAGGWSLPAPVQAVVAESRTAPPAEPPAVPRRAPAARRADAEPAPPASAATAAGVALPTLAPPTSIAWLAADPTDPDGLPPAAAAVPELRRLAPPAWTVSVAVALWLAGALLLTLRLALAHLALGWRLRSRTPIAGGPLASLVARLRAAVGVRRAVRLSRSQTLPVPIARGVVRGEICLPERALAELSAGEQEGMVAHEMAHLIRRDPAWLLAARTLECLFFVQPLHAVARRRLREIAEYRCDDWAARATGRPLSLARCLTEVAGWSLGRTAALPVPSMAAGGRSALGRRVRRLLEPSGGDDRRPRWLPLVATGALLAVAAVAPGVWGPATAAGQEPEDEAAAIERAIEEEYAREQADLEALERSREAGNRPDPDYDDRDAGDSDDRDGDDYGGDADSDDSDERESEAEQRADAAEDEVMEAFELEMEGFEEAMEATFEPFEEQFESDMESFGEALEEEMEAFEEELERSFEGDFEAMAEELETMAEEMAERGAFADPDFVALMAELGTRIGTQAAALAESFSAVGAETGALMEGRFGEDFARRVEELAEAATPDPETLARLQPELERLQAEARRLAEENRYTGADAERMRAEARALAAELRPTREELERIQETARRLAEEAAPTREELERIRTEQRRAIERWRTEHRDELERTREDLATERERMRVELERMRERQGREMEQRRQELDREHEEMELQREEMRQQREELRQREEERRQQEEERRRREEETARESEPGAGP